VYGPLSGHSLNVLATPDSPVVADGPDVAPVVSESDSTAGGSIWALFLGLGLLMMGNGLNGAIIGVKADTAGFGVTVMGVIVAGFYAGFLLAPGTVVRALSSVGHIRVFAGLASTASSAVLMHAVSVLPVTWILMRFVFGFCAAGLYIVIESWLNELSDPANRGKTLALYMMVSMGGMGIGQSLVAFADPNGFRLFLVSSVLVSMSLVPMTLAGTTKSPTIRAATPVRFRELVSNVPTGVVGSFMTGAATGVSLGLGTVFATQVGLSLTRTAGFLLAATIGGIVMQFPIGRLSDRIRRRVVIFGVASIGASLALIGVVIPPTSPAMLVLMFGIGGCLYPLYSLVVAYTLDWMGPAKTVGSSATLMRINGSGALVGPLVTAPLMAFAGPDWFFWMISGGFALVVGFIAFRILFKKPLPIDRESRYAPFPARASAFAFELVTRPVRGAARSMVGRRITLEGFSIDGLRVDKPARDRTIESDGVAVDAGSRKRTIHVERPGPRRTDR